MKKHIKKLVCFALVATCLLATVASAYALTGTVVGGRLKLRKTASTTALVIGYIPDGSSVTILNSGAITNGFYHITAPSYLSGETEDDCILRTGYGMATYIE